jgi:hypothetical protein
MIENKGTTRSFRRAAANAKKVFDNMQITNETKADFPRQLADLQEKLKKEENAKYPDEALIKRIKAAIAVKQRQVEMYSGTDR